MVIDDLQEFISSLRLAVPKDYCIGIHGVTGNRESFMDNAKNIVDNGLKFSGWGGILSNVSMYS